MKYLYALPLLLLLVTSCAKDKKEDDEVIDREKTDWAFYKLNGNVKSVAEKSNVYTNNVKGGIGRENTIEHDSDMQFNDKGMLVFNRTYRTEASILEEYTHEGKDKIIKRVQYINDKPGIITQYSWDPSGKNNTAITRRNPDNSPIDRVEMKFAGKNMTNKTSYNNQNNPIDIITYDYDKNGNQTGENLFLGIQSVQVKSVYKYDDKNRKTEDSRYSKDTLVSKTVIEYDGNDNIVRKETFDSKNQLEYSDKYTYDDNNNILSNITFQRADNLTYEEVYTYDSNNNKTSLVYSKNGTIVMKAAYAYDGNKNIISAKTSNDKGVVVDNRSYKYEYDAKKNWTKKITTINNGQQQFLTVRTITYF